LSADSAAAAVRAGVSRIEEHPFLVDLRGDPVRAARDRHLDPGAAAPRRMLELARSALAEVVGKLGAKAKLDGKVLLFVGVAEPRLGWTEQAVTALRRELEAAPGPGTWAIHTLAQGHASALELLRRGAEEIDRGTCDLCLVGGVDSYLDADALLWLDANEQLRAEGIPSGFPPGEGAGFLALASEVGMRALGRSPLATVRLACSAHETNLIKTDAINLGAGLTEVLGRTARYLQDRGAAADDVYGDLNGERYRTEEWGFAVLRLPEILRDAALRANGVASWGDAGAASGALTTVLAVQSWLRGHARGPYALVWGSSEQGLRSAVLLEGRNLRKGAA
jgi:3-oxoacyl-[acyl-carrier-protein] synthase-1